MPDEPAQDRLIVLRHPDLRRYLSARFLVGLATQIQTVAVGWQVFSATGDPFDLGLVALSQFLPFILLILPAGHVADRYDRRRVQLATYVLLVACSVALLALSLRGSTDIAPVLAVMALFGIARAFNQPTGQALLPNLAPIGLFPRAVAVNSSLGQVATIAGPAIGGALVLLGVEVAYALAVVLLLAGVVLVAGLRAAAGGGVERADFVGDAAVGRHVRPLPADRARLDLARPVRRPLRRRDRPPPDLRRRRPRRRPRRPRRHARRAGGRRRAARGRGVDPADPVAASADGCSAASPHSASRRSCSGCRRSLPLSVAALVVMGAGDMVSVYIRHLLVQLETPDEIRGRVSAVNSVFIGASNELGEFESGVTAAWWGIVPAVVVGGAATLAVAATWTRLFPVLWRLDRFPDHREGAE